MKRIQHLEKLDSPPKPHQYFDLIAGTGTGAIQACMLGRLRTGVDEAIESYASVAKEVFSERKWIGKGAFRTTKLKDAIRNTIQTVTGDPDELMMERDPTTPLVFAMSRHNMRAGIPTAFRSYTATANEGPRCTVWETVCATMAHPELFKSFDIGSPPLKQSFVDAGLGCSNPLAHVLAEVKRLHPGRHVSTILSIGTGHTSTIQIPDRPVLRQFLPTAAIGAMKGIAEDAERVAEEIARRFSSVDGVYFRLNVDQGLQSAEVSKWDQRGEVAEHTRAYMRTFEVIQTIDKAAQAVRMRNPTISTAQIDGEIQLGVSYVGDPNVVSVARYCPPLSPLFTGCRLKIRRTESCIIGSDVERKVCVVHGLGGAGKTQMVLKVIETTRHKWKEIIYIDSSTRESIEAGLQEVATAKKLGDTHRSTLQWLESCREPWLLVLDSADDPSVSIRDYIPRGNHGSVIITTRLSGMTTLARGQNSECRVSGMDPDDAMTLLLKCARLHDRELSLEEVESAEVLLGELGYFALGIVHAGSFIGNSPHMSLTDYRALFMREQRRALEAYSNLPAAIKADDYRHTVYTAWIVCYDGLSSLAQELLWLIGYLHYTGITVDMFRRAAVTIISYQAEYPVTQLEDMAQQKLKEALCGFMSSSGEWDGLLFTQVIDELASQSLLEYDRMNQAYRIHLLVQSWVRTVIPYESDLAAKCAEMLVSISVSGCMDDGIESVMVRMSVGLHVDRVLLECGESTGIDHLRHFYEVYMGRGRWDKAEQLQEHIKRRLKQMRGDEHPDTLRSMNSLAIAYSRLGRYEDARALYTQVLDTRNQVLGSDHPDTLTTMHGLAIAYSDLGRYEDARALYTEVLDTREQVLGSNHPNTLRTMNNLAGAYSDLGRYEDARVLHNQVLDTQKQVLGSDHPDTLRTMNNLASAYSDLGQYEDARALHNQVLDTRKQVLGSNHPDTLVTINDLANAYSDLGRYDDARALYTQVLDTRKQVLGTNHPDTLVTINDLASAYSDLGRYEDARALYTQVLEIRKQVLGTNHPDTLVTMNNLATTYSDLGQYEDARALHTQVLEIRKQVLGNNHPDTLGTMNGLATTYSDLGRYEDARVLHTQVLDTQKQVLGNNHPDTLRTMNNLAGAYSDLGQYEDARALHNQVLDTRKQVLGSNHPNTLRTMNNLASAYSDLGQYDNARALHAQVLDTREQVLGNDHPDTLATMNKLANAYYCLGQYEDARALYTQVLDTRKQVLGGNHPDTLATMNKLAHAYYCLGRYEDARALYTQVLDTRERVLGTDHPDTLATMNNLAHAYYCLAQYEDARALYTQVLDTRKQVLGGDHPDTLVTTNDLARAYLILELVQEADSLNLNVGDFVNIFGEGHIHVILARAFVREIQDQRHREAHRRGILGRLKSYVRALRESNQS
ncbi:Patatin-like phospholipase, partial [Rhizoctonia solani]